MENQNSSLAEIPAVPPRCPLKIFAAGGAGAALMQPLAADPALAAELVVVDTGGAPGAGTRHIEIARAWLGGHGSHRSEPGKVELEAQAAAVRGACAHTDAVFILAGLGGRTGSWMSDAIAREARAAGAAVYAFVTLPFNCEGSVRFSKARQALDRLANHCDFVFVQAHEDFHASQAAEVSLREAYAPAGGRLLAALQHVAAALTGHPIMGIGFADLCALLRERNVPVVFAVGRGEGAQRAATVTAELLAHPRLRGGKSLAEAEIVAVSLVGGQDLRMADVNGVMPELGQHWQDTSHLLSATATAAAEAPLRALLLVATREAPHAAPRFDADPAADAGTESGGLPAPDMGEAPELKRKPRFDPTLEATTAMTAHRSRGGRGRPSASRLKQGQLQLDIANKGRFEKSEPTIHKGEDLDLPTYLRRGVVMN
jgi:cell division protein FtsZ